MHVLRKPYNHIFFWLLYTASISALQWSQTAPGYLVDFFIADQIAKYSLAITVFYCFLYVLNSIFERKKFIVKFILGLFVVAVYYALKYLIYYQLIPTVFMESAEPFNAKYFFLPGIWWIVHYMLYAWGYWYYFKSLSVQAKNLELQNEKLTAEYNYLKAQINPHFLYNTLNFFYAETLDTSPKVANGIELLSHLMRYSLRPADADGKVPLSEEVFNLNNYLGLQKMRFEEGLNLSCNLPANIPASYRILPHLLLTLAENAFKHGDPGEPMSISLRIQHDGFNYTVSNTERGSSTPSSGVGLQNMQSRLKLFYGNDARFNYTKQNGVFTAELEVKRINNPVLK